MASVKEPVALCLSVLPIAPGSWPNLTPAWIVFPLFAETPSGPGVRARAYPAEGNGSALGRWLRFPAWP